MPEKLALEIRTPHGLAFQGPVDSVRVPTPTGLAGLRARGEPLVLAVEPGLIVFQKDDGTWFAATAGGLLASGRTACTLLTPFATVGQSEREIEEALDHMLATPPAELVARRRLEELERRIVNELTERPGTTARTPGRRPTTTTGLVPPGRAGGHADG